LTPSLIRCIYLTRTGGDPENTRAEDDLGKTKQRNNATENTMSNARYNRYHPPHQMDTHDILLALTLALGVVAFIAHMAAELDRYNRSEAGRCYDAHRAARMAHISFKSVEHGLNWCEAHEGDWRSKVNGRVRAAAKAIDARYDAEIIDADK
jgi:hypothetical protein